MGGENEHEAICHFCREPIHPDARRCPHCRVPQNWSRWCYHPAFLLFVLVAFVGVMGWFSLSIRRSFFGEGRPSPRFPEYRTELKVGGTRMEFGREHGDPAVGVVGHITNHTGILWKEIAVEVRFTDGEGRLVDVASDSVFGRGIAPGETRRFGIWREIHLPRERYASFDVRLLSAVEGG